MIRKQRSMASTIAASLLSVLISVSTLVPHDAGADSTTPASTLPVAKHGAAVAWDGSTHFYIFGGNPFGGSSKVIRYTPSTNTLTNMNATFPGYENTYVAAVWANGKAYTFGGNSNWSQIYEYDPAADILSLAATIPARHAASVAYDGKYVYIFGGTLNSLTYMNDIERFDPVTKEVLPMATILPTPRAFTSAVWMNGAAYIFGGFYRNPDDTPVFLSDILKFDPAANSVTKVADLPAPMAGVSAVYDGTNALLFGGTSDICLEALSCGYEYYAGGGGTFFNHIFKFDGVANKVTLMGSVLPTARADIASGWDGTQAFLFGGIYFSRPDLDHRSLTDILAYRPRPAEPEDLHANTFPDGSTTLTWSPPIGSSYSPAITGYRVYRATPSTVFMKIADTTASTYTDPDCASLECSYTVTAVNASGEGTAAAPMPKAPSSPSGIAAAGPGVGQITFSWSRTFDQGRPITSWRVYVGTDPSTVAFQSEVTTTSVTVSGLNNGERRYFKVEAVNSIGTGPPSSLVRGRAARRPGPPTNSSVYPNPFAGANTVYWYQPYDDGGLPLTGYRIYRSDGGPMGLIAEVSSDAYYYTDTSCPIGACIYYVSAVGPPGESSMTQPLVSFGWRP